MPWLHWLTREDDLRAADRVPYRLLDEVPELSHGAADAGKPGGLLVQGDNLEALKAQLSILWVRRKREKRTSLARSGRGRPGMFSSWSEKWLTGWICRVNCWRRSENDAGPGPVYWIDAQAWSTRR